MFSRICDISYRTKQKKNMHISVVHSFSFASGVMGKEAKKLKFSVYTIWVTYQRTLTLRFDAKLIRTTGR